MKIFLIVEAKSITITRRMEGDGGMLGDSHLVIKPDDVGDFYGWSYDELAALGSGVHDIPSKEVPVDE